MDIIIILPAIHLSHLPTILPVSSGFTFLLNVDGSFGHFHPIRALSLNSLFPFPYDSIFFVFLLFFFALFRIFGLYARGFSSSGAGSSNFIRSSGGAHGVPIQWLRRRQLSRR